MNILITAGIYPPEIGGPATYVPRIASELAKRGHHVTVVAPWHPAQAVPPTPQGYQLVLFQRACFLRFLNFFIELFRALIAVQGASRGMQIIYANGLDLPALLASRWRRLPLIVKVVGDSAWEFAHTRGLSDTDLEDFQSARGLQIHLLRFWFQVLPRAATAVIVPSDYIASVVLRWGVHAPVHVIQNEVELPVVTDRQIDPLQDPKAHFHLVFIGRLIPLKQVDLILSAVQTIPGVHLTIVGDGPQRPALERLVGQLQLRERVSFTGSLPKAKVWQLLSSSADALVLYSLHETMPHVLLEAAACRIPVIASAVGGVLELVEDNQTGLLVSPKIPQQLISALQRLQNDPALCRRLGENAYQTLSKRSATHMVDATEQVLLGFTK